MGHSEQGQQGQHGQHSDYAERIEVPKPLGDEQVRFFVDNGFLAAEGLVTPAEIEEIKQDAAFIARGGYPSETLKPLPADLTDDEILREILCIHHPYYVSPVMKRYALHPRICGALSQIVGAHLAHWDGNIKCMHSMLFIKPPQFQGRAWHQDETYIPTRDRTLTGAWIALDDANADNGGLWVIPGSHRAGYLYPERAETNPDEFDHADEAYGFDESAKVPVNVKAGTVVFFNGYLLHMSYKNRSDVYRRVLVNHYMSASSLLPWSFKDGPTVAKADRRTVLPAAGIDPYAWKGYAEPEGGPSLRTCKATDDIARAASAQS